MLPDGEGLEDGRLPLDKQRRRERNPALRLGRKSWLFSDSVGGAESSAALYGLAETAQLNGVNVYAYFKWVFTQLPRAQREADL